MSPLSKKPAVLVVTALGTLAMGALGWKAASPSATAVPDEPGSEASAAPARKLTSTSRKHGGPPDEVAQYMSAIRNAGSPEARQRATISLALSLPASEIGAWLESGWFDLQSGCELTLFTKILLERWPEEDPIGCLAGLAKNRGADFSATLAKMAEKNPAEVCEYFKAHPNKQIEMSMLQGIAAAHPERIMRDFKDLIANATAWLGTSDSYYRMQIFQLAAKADPAGLEAAMGSMSPGGRKEVENVLTGQRLATSFSDEFPKLLARPDGLSAFRSALSGDTAESVREHLLNELPNLPPEWLKHLSDLNPVSFKNAGTWLNADLEGAGVPAATASQIRSQALNYLSSQHPDQALDYLAGATDLKPDQRQSAIQQAMYSAANHPDQAETLIKKLSSDEQQTARGYLEDAKANRGTSDGDNKAAATPQEWLKKAGDADSKTLSSSQFTSAMRNWNDDQINELATSFRAMSDDKKAAAATAIASVGGTNGSSGPEKVALQGEALRYLVEQAPATPGSDSQQPQRYSETSPAFLSSRYAVALSTTDPDGAGSWVSGLPDGDIKVMAAKNLARNWAQFDPDAVQTWLGTLPEATRTEVQNSIAKKKK